MKKICCVIVILLASLPAKGREELPHGILSESTLAILRFDLRKSDEAQTASFFLLTNINLAKTIRDNADAVLFVFNDINPEIAVHIRPNGSTTLIRDAFRKIKHCEFEDETTDGWLIKAGNSHRRKLSSERKELFEEALSHPTNFPLSLIYVPGKFEKEKLAPKETNDHDVGRVWPWLVQAKWMVATFDKTNAPLTAMMPDDNAVQKVRSVKLKSLITANIGKTVMFKHFMWLDSFLWQVFIYDRLDKTSTRIDGIKHDF